MSKFAAVLIGLIMLPFIVTYLALLAILYVICVLYQGAIMPLEYLKGNIQKDGKEVFHANAASALANAEQLSSIYNQAAILYTEKLYQMMYFSLFGDLFGTIFTLIAFRKKVVK